MSAVLSFPSPLARPRVDAVRRAVRERAIALGADAGQADRAVAVALQALRRERRSAALSIHLGIRTLRTGARAVPDLDGAA